MFYIEIYFENKLMIFRLTRRKFNQDYILIFFFCCSVFKMWRELKEDLIRFSLKRFVKGCLLTTSPEINCFVVNGLIQTRILFSQRLKSSDVIFFVVFTEQYKYKKVLVDKRVFGG